MEDIVFRIVRTSALVALGCVMAGAAVAGCDDSSGSGNLLFGSKSRHTVISGTKKIKVDGASVNVSCSGRPAEGRPAIVLMAGYGDALTKLAGIQQTLSEKDLVCSYDRLGEGASDKPAEGLVLLDATSPTAVADTTKLIPKSAKGPAGEVRAEMVAINAGRNQERLKATDSKARSAGAIPVEVVKHGKKYLSASPPSP
jgi:hypothetical protein